MQKRCIHRLKIGVAAGAVDNGMKLRVQRHWMSADRDSEVWRVGCSIYGDVAQSSRVFAGRRENASNALDRAQIGFSEGVVSLHGRVARTVLLPRSEQTA